MTGADLARKRRIKVSIDSKVRIIQLLEAQVLTRAEVMEEFNISKSGISRIMKNKEQFQDIVIGGTPSDTGEGQYRLRRLKYYELEAPLLDFIETSLKKGKKPTGGQIKREATRLSEEFGFTEFKASNGWLYKYTRRFKALHGYDYRRSGCVPEDAKYFDLTLLKRVESNRKSRAKPKSEHKPWSRPPKPKQTRAAVKDEPGSPESEEEASSDEAEDADKGVKIEVMPERELDYDPLADNDSLLEPQCELHEGNVNDDEVKNALNTIKWALQCTPDVGFDTWKAFHDISTCLNK